MKTYCFTDLHGRYDIFKQIMNFVKPEDKLICLGDSVDRGPHGMKILKEALNNPQIKYLKGNHEDMMARVIDELLEGHVGRYASNWLYGNGGDATWETIQYYSDDTLKGWARILHRLPLKYEFMNAQGQLIICEHAGYSPCDIPHRSHDPLWDRAHFYDEWGECCYWSEDNNGAEVEYSPENVFLIHGHTPVQYLDFHYGYKGQDMKQRTVKEMKMKQAYMNGAEVEYQPQVIRYCDGHKFDIDMSCVSTGVAALIDCDTFEVTYIGVDGVVEVEND